MQVFQLQKMYCCIQIRSGGATGGIQTLQGVQGVNSDRRAKLIRHAVTHNNQLFAGGQTFDENPEQPIQQARRVFFPEGCLFEEVQTVR